MVRVRFECRLFDLDWKSKLQTFTWTKSANDWLWFYRYLIFTTILTGFTRGIFQEHFYLEAHYTPKSLGPPAPQPITFPTLSRVEMLFLLLPRSPNHRAAVDEMTWMWTWGIKYHLFQAVRKQIMRETVFKIDSSWKTTFGRRITKMAHPSHFPSTQCPITGGEKNRMETGKWNNFPALGV